MKKYTIYITLLLGIGLSLALWQGCSNDPVLPNNPYDEVDYGTEDPNTATPDPNSLTGIHKNILVPKCNNPGCHDGTFEPDFRTVQSTWSTLVYHSIVKNTPDSSYTYRVIPNDTSASMLIRRLTVEDPALQRMPATGNYVTDAELENIVTWINNGALDAFGLPGTPPNDEPSIFYLGLDTAYNQIDGNRLDNINYNPFIVPADSTLILAWILDDDSTADVDMLVNETKFSLDKDDFSTATSINAVWFEFASLWATTVDVSTWTPGDTVYFRHYVNDGDHAFNTEFPRDESQDAYKTYFSFYIEP